VPRRKLHLWLPGERRRGAVPRRRVALPLRPRLRLHARRVLRLPLKPLPAPGRMPGVGPRQSGMFECLRQGSSIFFAASIASERQIRRRVSCGWITSSM